MSYKPTLFLILFCLLPFKGLAQKKAAFQELLNQKQYTKIIASANALTKADSTDYDIMYIIGQAYDGMLRYKMAYIYYDHCYRMDTTRIDIINTLARSAINTGRTAGAERFFLKALEADTLSFYANNQLANFYYQSGEYVKAISIYQRLLDIDEKNPALLRALGNCYTKTDAVFPAIFSYSQAFNYNPENAGLAGTLINSMLGAGGHFLREAISVCDTALHYNPNNRQLLQHKGMVLYANERYAEADTIYAALMVAGDSTYTTQKYRGLAQYHTKQFANAVKQLESAYIMDTTSIDVCMYLGAALSQTKNFERAFTLFDQAEEGMKPPASYSILLKSFRADTHKNNNQKKIASRLYYELWKERPKRMDFLSHIYQMNMKYPLDYEKPEEQQAALFIQILFTQKVLDLKQKEHSSFISSMRMLLQKIRDHMFFIGKESLPMLAPDGNKSVITMDELQALIAQMSNDSM